MQKPCKSPAKNTGANPAKHPAKIVPKILPFLQGGFMCAKTSYQYMSLLTINFPIFSWRQVFLQLKMCHVGIILKEKRITKPIYMFLFLKKII